MAGLVQSEQIAAAVSLVEQRGVGVILSPVVVCVSPADVQG